MLATDFGIVYIFIGFAHLTECRVLVLRDLDDGPFILDHIEELNQEEEPQNPQPIIYDHTPKRTRSSKKAIVQYGRHVYHLNNYEDMKELRSKRKQEPITYDYVDIGELIRSRNRAKNGIIDYLKDLLVSSDTPLRFCYGRQCEDLRRSKKHKHKDNDETDWKQKKMQMPLGHMKRFQIVDNRHNSVRKPKGSEEFHEKKKRSKRYKKKKKYSSGSAESKHSEETDVNNEDDSAAVSFEKWKNHDESPKSEEDIPKKKTKKKKKHIDASAKTKRKTIPLEDTYFMQGNKIYHSFGKSKKKRDSFDKRRRLEHFMPKRYHWDPSEIHELGYYWFNGPKGLYPDPKTLSK